MDHPPRPSAKVVGDEFAKEYYTILQDYPQHLRGAYQDSSKIGRTRSNGMMCLHTLSDIDDENLYGGFGSTEVTSIVSRYCQGRVVLVVVGGYSTLKETLEMRKSFTQVFFLASQEAEGYFVLIDLLHFDDQTIVSASNVIEERVPETEVPRKEVADGLLRVSEPDDGLEDVSKISDASVAIHKGQEQELEEHRKFQEEQRKLEEEQSKHQEEDSIASISPVNKVIEEKVPETEVTRKEVEDVPETEATRKEVADGLLGVSVPNDGLEDVSKISNASAVIQSGQGQHPSSDHNDDTGNENSQVSKVLTEGSTVHVTNLPPINTSAKVMSAFKTFGAIEQIHVKNPNSNYYYGFVDFKEANAVNRAIKASPVNIDGRQVLVSKARGKVFQNKELCITKIENKTFQRENLDAEASPVKIDGRQVHVEKTQDSRGHCLIPQLIDPPAPPSAEEVGNAFAYCYYLFLQEYPQILYRIYQENSTITRPGEGGMMRDFTLLSINEDLDMLHSRRFDSAVVTSVISQDSLGGGVLVVVRGHFTSNKRPERNFNQTFFLAPQENGYFVFNDFFNFETEVNDFWDWQKSKEEQSKSQEKERGTGVYHPRNYGQVMEEHGMIQEELRKLQEEQKKLQEEMTKLQEEKMKLQEEKTKFQEEKMKLHEERMKLHEEKIQEEKTKLQEEKTKLQGETMKFQEETMKLQKEKRKLQEEHRKLKEEEENKN